MKKKKMSAEDYAVNMGVIAQKEMLTIQEASLFTGLSISFIYKLNHWRKLVRYQPNGKLCYYRKQDLLDWMQSNRIGTSEEVEQKAMDYCMATKAGKPQMSLKKRHATYKKPRENPTLNGDVTEVIPTVTNGSTDETLKEESHQ